MAVSVCKRTRMSCEYQQLRVFEQYLAEAEGPLWVESCYRQFSWANGCFRPQSGYTIGLILSETYSCFRPKADLQIIGSDSIFRGAEGRLSTGMDPT